MGQNIIICLICPGSGDLLDQVMENWITEFGTNLNFLLERFIRAKAEVRIVTDKDLNKKDLWQNAACYIFLVRDTFLSDKTYISFLSTIHSEFIPGQTEYTGLSRKIYRVNLSDISGTSEPAFIWKIPSYDFYQIAEDNQGNVLLVAGMKEYWPRFLDLITDLKISLQQYISDGKGREAEEAVVYLAATAPDQEQNRDIIRRELLVHGYRVYPDIELNFSVPELKTYIQEYIDKSTLAIHLLGDHYGSGYPGAEVSITELQLQYITEYIDILERDPSLSTQSKLLRMIWLPPEMKPADERQEQLISQLRRDIEKMSRTDIIQAPLELFKTLIISKLKESSRVPTEEEETKKEKSKLVYLIHDKRDEEGIQSVGQAIHSRGFQTAKISYDNGSPNLINLHKELLIQCDAALVYHHSGSRTWLMSKLSDLMKAPGLGRISPMRAKGILITGSDPADNISFPQDTLVMRGKDPLDQLDLFIEKLK